MKEYKLFLASSEELATDHRAFEEHINELSNDAIYDGKLKPVIWENFME